MGTKKYTVLAGLMCMALAACGTTDSGTAMSGESYGSSTTGSEYGSSGASSGSAYGSGAAAAGDTGQSPAMSMQAPGRLLTHNDVGGGLIGRHAELYWPDDNLWYLIKIQVGAGGCWGAEGRRACIHSRTQPKRWGGAPAAPAGCRRAVHQGVNGGGEEPC